MEPPKIGGPPPKPLVADPELVAKMLFNTAVIYGPTGSRKTSQIREFAKYIYEKTGKKTRLITFDGGGFGTAQDFVNAGIIEPWRMVDEPNPRASLIKASRGAWPERLINGLRGGNRIIEYLPGERLRALGDVGAYAIEGWYSIAQAIMGADVASGRKISEDVVGLWAEGVNPGDTEGLEKFGAPARSHYGAAQRFTLDYIRNFSALPLERVLYTSLEGKGIDKMDNVLKYGPAVAGGAITSAIPAYVGDCLHFEDFIQEEKQDPKNPGQKLIRAGVRVWFSQHPDISTGALWPAKSRVIASKIGEFLKRIGPGGYFILGDNSEPSLYTYFKLQDELVATASDEAIAWKKKIDEERNNK